MTLYECLLAVLCNLWLVFNISVGCRLKDITRQLQIDLSFGSLAQNLSKNAAKLTLPPSNWGFPVWTPVRIEDFYCHHSKDNKIAHRNNQSVKFDPLPPPLALNSLRSETLSFFSYPNFKCKNGQNRCSPSKMNLETWNLDQECKTIGSTKCWE